MDFLSKVHSLSAIINLLDLKANNATLNSHCVVSENVSIEEVMLIYGA